MNREDLEYDISIALDRWDKHSTFTLAGVKNITKEDIDTLLLICDYHDQHGCLYPLSKFPKTVTDVLKHYGML